jgi:hypothetical protein
VGLTLGEKKRTETKTVIYNFINVRPFVLSYLYISVTVLGNRRIATTSLHSAANWNCFGFHHSRCLQHAGTSPRSYPDQSVLERNFVETRKEWKRYTLIFQGKVGRAIVALYHHFMNAYQGRALISYSIPEVSGLFYAPGTLTSHKLFNTGGEWSVLRSGHLDLCTQRIWGRLVEEWWSREKSQRPYQESNPSGQSEARYLADWALLGHSLTVIKYSSSLELKVSAIHSVWTWEEVTGGRRVSQFIILMK